MSRSSSTKSKVLVVYIDKPEEGQRTKIRGDNYDVSWPLKLDKLWLRRSENSLSVILFDRVSWDCVMIVNEIYVAKSPTAHLKGSLCRTASLPSIFSRLANSTLNHFNFLSTSIANPCPPCLDPVSVVCTGTSPEFEPRRYLQNLPIYRSMLAFLRLLPQKKMLQHMKCF